jgi:hypothetical protein
MGLQYTPYALPLLVAAAVSAGLALFAWRRRGTPGAGAVFSLGRSPTRPYENKPETQPETLLAAPDVQYRIFCHRDASS